MKGADLILANLSSAHAAKANLSGANLRGATLYYGDFRGAFVSDRTYLAHADLRAANFTGATMGESNTFPADLTKTCFDGADLTGAELSDAILDETSLLGTNLHGAIVGGTFIRRVKTDDKTDQSDLLVDVHVAWERRPGEMIKLTEADDIRVAQFHNIVDEPGSVGKLLAATTQRVVLILGTLSAATKKSFGSPGESLERTRQNSSDLRFPLAG